MLVKNLQRLVRPPPLLSFADGEQKQGRGTIDSRSAWLAIQSGFHRDELEGELSSTPFSLPDRKQRLSASVVLYSISIIDAN